MPNSDEKKSEPGDREKVAKAASGSLTDVLHFEKWIELVGERGATDLHLAVGNVPMLRISGEITPLLEEDVLTAERLERVVHHILSDAELTLLDTAREVVVSRTFKKVMRFRIHIFYSRGFPVVSLRHIQESRLGFAELGLPETMTELCTIDQGLVIVTGPFDSGKTTTVQAMIDYINRTTARYLVTLEAPIERLIPSDKSVVVQREVGRDVTSFAEGLAALRDEDVDVVVAGSLEAPGVPERAIELANTGRLVIAVAHSRTAVSALTQVRDSVPPGDRERILNLLGDALVGAVAQILLPKIGGGRKLIVEVLRATHPIKQLIRENKLPQIPNLMQTSRQEGMVTLDRGLADAVKAGEISMQDAKDHAIDTYQFNILVSH